MTLYPLALAALGMAPLCIGLWVAARDLGALLDLDGDA